MGFRIAAGDAQDALGALIDAALAGTDVRSGVGYPPGGPDAEHVYVSGEFDAELQYVVSGGTQHDETAPLTVVIVVSHPESEMAPNRDRALELAALIGAALTANPSFSCAVRWSRITAAAGREAVDDDGRRVYMVRLTVTYDTTVDHFSA